MRKLGERPKLQAVIAPAEDIVTLTGLLPEADRRTYLYLLKGVLSLVKVYAEGRALESVPDLTDETNICYPAVVAEAERALGLFEEKGDKPWIGRRSAPTK